MRCCDVEKLWDDMRDALQPHREAVIKHLRACPPCQELYEQYEGIAYCLTCSAAAGTAGDAGAEDHRAHPHRR